MSKPEILIVDDDETILQLYQDALSPQYSITPANDWVLGVDLLISRHFDILILDLRMSLLDPVELIKKIRAENITIPILVSSAYPNLRDRMAGLPVQAILAKPFTIANLESTVSNLIADSNAPKTP